VVVTHLTHFPYFRSKDCSLLCSLFNSGLSTDFRMAPLFSAALTAFVLAICSPFAVALPTDEGFERRTEGNETLFTAKNVKAYDYVIVGGGLSGLVVANRLSEDKSSM